jgi:hypothetical protein
MQTFAHQRKIIQNKDTTGAERMEVRRAATIRIFVPTN